VGIAVVNWNNAPDTIECLSSLQKILYPDFFTVIVDNASTDGSEHEIRSRFSNIHVIRMEDNLGYAAACNAAIQYCLANGAEAILLLNNDVIVDPQILTEMTRFMEIQRSIGIAGPLVLNSNDRTRIFSAGGRFEKYSGRNWAIDQGSRATS